MQVVSFRRVMTGVNEEHRNWRDQQQIKGMTASTEVQLWGRVLTRVGPASIGVGRGMTNGSGVAFSSMSRRRRTPSQSRTIQSCKE